MNVWVNEFKYVEVFSITCKHFSFKC